MILITGGVLLVLEVGFAVFCFVDMVLSPEHAVRWMPRWGWVLALLFFPVAAAVAWTLAGSPRRVRLRGQAATRAEARPAGPLPSREAPGPVPGSIGSLADDAAFLARLWEVNEETERFLQRWERDLRRREQALRARSRRVDAA
jgi:hypothetical protein